MSGDLDPTACYVVGTVRMYHWIWTRLVIKPIWRVVTNIAVWPSGPTLRLNLKCVGWIDANSAAL